MKHQQVVIDYWSMVKTSCLCLLLAFSGYILIKMVQTIFWLPSHLKKNQKRLEELAAQYAQDIEPEERERIERMIRGEPEVNANSDSPECVPQTVEGEQKKVK